MMKNVLALALGLALCGSAYAQDGNTGAGGTNTGGKVTTSKPDDSPGVPTSGPKKRKKNRKNSMGTGTDTTKQPGTDTP